MCGDRRKRASRVAPASQWAATRRAPIRDAGEWSRCPAAICGRQRLGCPALSCTDARFASWSPRSGDAIGRGQPHYCSPSSPRNARHKLRAAEGAEPVGAVIRRPSRHCLAFCRLGEGTSLGPAQGVRVRRSRVTARRAPFCSGAPGLNHGPSRSQSGPRRSRHPISHGAAFPPERTAPTPEICSSCQPFPQWKTRALPSAARLERMVLQPISGRPGPIPQAYPAAPPRAPQSRPRPQSGRRTGVQD